VAQRPSVEAEVKARVEDPDALEQRLVQLGAEARGSVEQVDRYLDHPCRSFADTDEALRVRVDDDGAVATYKRPKLDEATKSRREVEVGVEDPEAALAMFERLGFEPQPPVRKRRRTFAWEGATVVVDRVEGLGAFVELERRSYLELVLAAEPGAGG
jgi:adenylate cyclase class 2